jgi:GNAT superfamily N-acetyltransferase
VTAPTNEGAYVERALTADDVSRALALSTEAGWNQTAADWRYLLEGGRGFGLWNRGGELVATAMTVPYGSRFAWISMVLVHAPDRGRGLASRLLRRCIETLRAQAIVPVLDATPAGREVYRRLGFVDAWTMRRLRCVRAPAPVAGPATSVAIRPLDERDLGAIATFDRSAFGADRSLLLRHLRARLPAAALVAERGGSLAGFALSRDGRTAAQLGPLVALDGESALALTSAALRAIAGPVIVDVPDRHTAVLDSLRRAGFVEERPFTRMLYERSEQFDRPEHLFAIAGPELG